MIRMQLQRYPKGTLIEIIPGCELTRPFPQEKQWVVIGSDSPPVKSHYMMPYSKYDATKDYDALNYKEMRWTERNDHNIFLFINQRFHVIGSLANNAGNKRNLSRIEED